MCPSLMFPSDILLPRNLPGEYSVDQTRDHSYFTDNTTHAKIIGKTVLCQKKLFVAVHGHHESMDRPTK